MKLVKIGSKQFLKLCEGNVYRPKRLVKKVSKILTDVKVNGDKSVLKYTHLFDNVDIKSRELKVTQGEISRAYDEISSDFVNLLKPIIENISKFYRKQYQRQKSWKLKEEEGVVLGEQLRALDSIGVYIPAGTAPLISTVYMTVIPARIAGVKKIFLASPPNKNKNIDPHILVVADLLKVNEIYKIGGAQAIGAFAFGTKTVPKVDKIIGPGNMYVTEAKRQVFGYVDIDMLAGPSELVVVANKFSNVNYVKSDLEAQIEHNGGLSILVTPSKKLARILKQEIEKGFVIIVKNTEEAIDIVNKIAPEHVEVMMNNPQSLLRKIKNAGTVFLGPYSPTAAGDYVAGPSHVLPTSSTARFFSGIHVEDFLKKIYVISYTKKALEKTKASLNKIATLEGLTKHAHSVNIRFEE